MWNTQKTSIRTKGDVQPTMSNLCIQPNNIIRFLFLFFSAFMYVFKPIKTMLFLHCFSVFVLCSALWKEYGMSSFGVSFSFMYPFAYGFMYVFRTIKAMLFNMVFPFYSTFQKQKQPQNQNKQRKLRKKNHLFKEYEISQTCTFLKPLSVIRHIHTTPKEAQKTDCKPKEAKFKQQTSKKKAKTSFSAQKKGVNDKKLGA